MRIIFFGTPEIANPSLQALNNNHDIEIVGVVSQPDKPVGRKQEITASPVKQLANKLKIPIITEEELEEHKDVDFYVVYAYGQILPEKFLKLPKYGAINIHFSLLPKYRGASPMQEALKNGDTETGIAFMKLTKELDAGDIYLMKRTQISPDDNYQSLSQKLSELSAELLPHVLRDITSGDLTPLPQNHKNATFCKKITKEDAEIDFTKMTATEISNMIRAYSFWPVAWTTFNNKNLKILSATTSEETLPTGKFLAKGKTLKIGTNSGTLVPKRLQLEGKSPMDAATFINGYQNQF